MLPRLIKQEQSKMDHLPQTGYLRLKQIIGKPKANPPIPALIPIGKTSWWAGIKCGRYPKPIKLGPRTTVWRVSDILNLIQHGVAKESNDHDA